MSYHQFVDHHTKESYGSFEVFHQSPACSEHGGVESLARGSCHECAMLSGWYWWPCYSGCLPDGEASGPFETEEIAKQDALDTEDYV